MKAPPASGARVLLGGLSLALALYLLNLALTFHNVWPTPMVEDRGELSVELALLLLGLALWAERRGGPAGRVLALLATLLTVSALARYAEVTAPALFGRAINLYWDAQYLPAVAAMLARAAPAWHLALAATGAAALLAGLWWLFACCLRRVCRALDDAVPRRGIALLAAALAALYYAPLLGLPGRPAGWYALPLAVTYARQAHFLLDALDAEAAALPPAPAVDSDLAGARGVDVFVVFAESYGAAVFDNPALDAAVAPARAALAEAVHQTGRGVVSAYLRAPTFGGGSWLSHASLFAGVEVSDPRSYALLLTERRETLATRFSARGYRTLALMPGLRNAWPEGRFYGFDRIVDAAALDYRGPAFGWWRIPDQYALARLEQLEPAAGRPRLVFFPTISSHVPFLPTPPYQPDWRQVLKDPAWEPQAVARALAVEPDWSALAPAYSGAIVYVHRWLAGWLREHSRRPLLLLVLGDHQPPAAVSGADAGYEVPVHVVSDDEALLAALGDAGFVSGLRPRRPALGPLHELHALLLESLDGRRRPAQGRAGAVAPMAAAGSVPSSDSTTAAR